MNASVASILTGSVTTILGVILGLLAEPIKSRWQRQQELKVVRREIYLELARYIAAMERVEKMQFDAAKKAVTKKPDFYIIDWYKTHNLDLLLRIDASGDLRLLYSSLRDAIGDRYEHANTAGNAKFGLPWEVKTLVKHLGAAYQKTIDIKLLRSSIEQAHSEHATWEQITKAAE
jgi:hypothetical protein